VISDAYQRRREERKSRWSASRLQKRVGGNAFDSSAGFAICPRLRIYAPDASWVSRPRIDALTPVQASGFWPISSDVAIDAESNTGEFRDVVAKIELYVEAAAATPSRSTLRRVKSASAVARPRKSTTIRRRGPGG